MNYEYTIFPVPKTVGGVDYRSYNVLSARREILLNELIQSTTAGEVVYDIGAHTGYYTLPLAALGCQVYAFEPNPRTFEKLETNVELNEFNDVELFNVGLAETSASTTFYQSIPEAYSSFNEFNAKSGTAEILSTIDMEVTAIDRLVSEGRTDRPDHIKIDVEGFGLEVLRGGKETITEYQPTIYFEPHAVEEGNTRQPELYEFFDDVGYVIEEVDGRWICRTDE